MFTLFDHLLEAPPEFEPTTSSLALALQEEGAPQVYFAPRVRTLANGASVRQLRHAGRNGGVCGCTTGLLNEKGRVLCRRHSHVVADISAHPWIIQALMNG